MNDQMNNFSPRASGQAVGQQASGVPVVQVQTDCGGVAEGYRMAGSDLDARLFGRWRDVEKKFGLKRGKTYQLASEGKIKTVSLRKPGQCQGVRLFHMPSIEKYLMCLLVAQNPGGHLE